MQFDQILDRNLNAYHKAFLLLMSDEKVDFLIIGGQARCVFITSETCDLDVWVHHETTNLYRFIVSFHKWRDRFPNHTRHWQRLVPDNFPVNAHISLPDADVSVNTENADELKLTERNNIDILFSLEHLNFDVSYQNACATKFGKLISERDWLVSQEYRLKL